MKRTLIVQDQLSGTRYYVTDMTIAEAAAAVRARFPGGFWSRTGSKEYREIEREYTVSDIIITITSTAGIKDSVLAKATTWEQNA